MYTKDDLETFFDAYVEAALFSTNDESDERGGEPLDANYGPEDLSEQAEDKMIADCKKFLDRAWPLIEEAPDLIERYPKVDIAGGDFWFTRNGHGTGFWAHGWPKEIGQKLTQLAKRFGETNLYVGDDGTIDSD